MSSNQSVVFVRLGDDPTVVRADHVLAVTADDEGVTEVHLSSRAVVRVLDVQVNDVVRQLIGALNAASAP